MRRLPQPALRLAAAALAAAASLALVLALLGSHGSQGLGETGTYHILIVGPDAPVWNGTVLAENATALGVLQAAAAVGGFEVTVQDYGVPCGLYVRGIAGHVASQTASEGWIFEVRDPGGDWVWADRSAECYPLQEGQDLRWRWSQSP